MNTIIGSRQPTSMMDYMQNNPYTRSLELRDSSMFRQTSPEGRSRMMQNVSRGLPANVDPQRVFVSGYRGLVPQYSAALGASGGFGGGWGQVGQPQDSTGKLKAGAPLGSAGSSGYALAEKMESERSAATRPTAGAAESRVGYDEQLARDVSMGSGVGALPFTGFGSMVREEMGNMPIYSSYWNQTLTPRFPFSNY